METSATCIACALGDMWNLTEVVSTFLLTKWYDVQSASPSKGHGKWNHTKSRCLLSLRLSMGCTIVVRSLMIKNLTTLIFSFYTAVLTDLPWLPASQSACWIYHWFEGLFWWNIKWWRGKSHQSHQRGSCHIQVGNARYFLSNIDPLCHSEGSDSEVRWHWGSMYKRYPNSPSYKLRNDNNRPFQNLFSIQNFHSAYSVHAIPDQAPKPARLAI